MKIIYSILIILLIIGCNDKDYLVEKNGKNYTIDLNTFITKKSNDYSYSISTKQKDTLSLDDEILFSARVYLNGLEIDDNLNTATKIQRWIIDQDTSYSPSYNYTCSKIGWHNVSFELIDHFNDTIRHSLDFLVNTPIKIDSIYTPLKNLHNAPVDSTKIKFKWSILGIDSSEIIENKLYLSPFIDSLYTSEVAINIGRDSITEIDYAIDLKKWFEQEEIDTTDSFKLYWAISSAVINSTIKSGYVDSSSAFNFQTQLKKNQLSKIVAKYNYKNNLNHSGILISLLKIDSLSSTYDTIYQSSTDKNGYFSFDSLYPGKYVLQNFSLSRPEYRAEDVKLNLDARTYYSIDSVIFLYDYYPPQAVMLNSDTLTLADVLKVRLSDYGAGLRKTGVNFWVDENSVEFNSLENDIYSFSLSNYTENISNNKLNLRASFSDSAQNKNENISWDIFIKD